MKRLLVRATLILAGLSLAAGALAADAQVPAAKTINVQAAPAVGTFDRGSIVLAFYRSPQWEAILADRRFELNAVKAANDTARARELEKYGAESQERAMEQLMGKAPLDNILAVLQPELKELTTRLKLASIVDSSTSEPNDPSVDVTSLLMDWLKASYETRKMATDLHAKNLPPK
jgi:hypothetical protein